MRTAEQLRAEIEQYREIAQQDRIERGLPPERPSNFVDETLSYVLYDDKLADFYPIAVRYAKIITGGTFIVMDTDKLVEYRKYAEMLQFSKVFNVRKIAFGIVTLLNQMDTINKAVADGTTDGIEYKRIVSLFSLCVSLIHVDKTNFRYDYASEEAHSVREARMKADEDALRNDEERYAAEVVQTFKQYEEIKELI